jgi:hypothetical protein
MEGMQRGWAKQANSEKFSILVTLYGKQCTRALTRDNFSNSLLEFPRPRD